MAKHERELHGDYIEILSAIVNGILEGNKTATLEDSSDFKSGNVRCSVRVFERYSVIDHNRLSLTVTLFQDGDAPIMLSAISAGGSNSMFIKWDTIGEENFLTKFVKLLDKIDAREAVSPSE